MLEQNNYNIDNYWQFPILLLIISFLAILNYLFHCFDIDSRPFDLGTYFNLHSIIHQKVSFIPYFSEGFNLETIINIPVCQYKLFFGLEWYLRVIRIQKFVY